MLELLVIILILFAVFGGGFTYWRGGWGGPGGPVGLGDNGMLILIVVVILVLLVGGGGFAWHGGWR